MIGVNESKGSAHIQSAFSIVKNMLSDPQDFEREYRTSGTEQYDTSFLDTFYPQPDFAVSEEEFAAIMRGERQEVKTPAPIVMGLSKPRVIAVEDRPETECNDYQSRVVDSKGRVSVGLHYRHNQTWSQVDSIITYFGILDNMPGEEFIEEKLCDFYKLMLSQATQLFILEDRSFIMALRKANYQPNWLVLFHEANDMAVELPSGKRIIFDDF